MRKKATYWGVALSLALGATAVAAYSPTLNLFGAGISALADDATDDATETSLGVPTSVTPADGSTFGGEKGLYQVKAVFAGTISVNRESTAPVTLKNAAGEVLQSIDPSAISSIQASSKTLTLNLTALLANGTYTVNIPAGLLNVQPDEGGESVLNDAIVLTYTGDYAEPTSTTPANGSKVIQDGGLGSVTLFFEQTVTLNRYVSSAGDDNKTTIFVKKDGEVVHRIPLSDTKGFTSGDGNDDFSVKVNFPEPLITPGEYEIVIPACAVYVANKTDDGIAADKTNPVITLNYIVEKPWHYSVFPGLGSQVKELKDFQVVFSDATAIELTTDYDVWDAAELQFVTAGKASKVSLFDLSTEGNNTLKLTANDPYTTPVTNVATQWNQIYLPAGLLTLTIDGEKVPSPELTLSKYQVLAFSASDFSSSVIGVTEGIPAQDMTEVNIHVDGDNVAFAGTNFTYIYLYPVNNGTVVTTAHANYSMAAADGEGNFKLTMRPATSNTSVLGHPELWETGQYIIRMPAKAVSKSLNGATVTNLAVDLGPIYINGVSAAIPTSVTPADGTVINTKSGLKTISMIFGSAMEGVAGKNIAVYREGETNPISTVAANGSTVVYANSNKTVDFSFPLLNTPGTYRVVVPQGAFRQTAGNGLENEEMTFTYVLPEVMDFTAVPADYSVCTTNEELNTITLTYPDAESIVFTDPETPVVLPLCNGTATSIKTNYTASIEGNKIILTAPEGFKHAVSANDLFFLIPGGIWEMKGKDGKTYQNLPETLVYKFSQLERPSISLESLSEITIDDIKDGFTVYAPEGYVVASVNKTISYCPKLYKNNYVPGGQTLTTSAANTYAQFWPIVAEDTKSVKFMPITEAFKKEVLTDRSKYTKADSTAMTKFTTLYNTDGIVSGNYYLRVFGSATYTSASVAFGKWEKVEKVVNGETVIEDVLTPYPNTAPWNYIFDVKGLEAFPVQTDLKASYESLPDQIVLSSEAGELGFFPALKPTFYIRSKVGSSWNTGQALTAEVADGKIIVTIPAAVKTKLATTYSEMCITTTSAGSTLATGAFKVGTGTNEEGTYTFNVTGPITNPDHTVAPAQGNLAVGEALSEITFTYPEGFPVEINSGTSASIYVTKEGETVPVAAITASDLKVEDNVVTIPMPAPITADGLYTVSIPRTMFLYGELQAYNVAYELTYKVTSLASATVSSVTPKTGSTIPAFQKIDIEFSKPTDIASVETVGNIEFTFVNPLDPASEPTTYPLYAYANPSDGASLVITFDEATEAELKAKDMWPLQMPGNYTVTIPTNSVVITTDDGTQYGFLGRTLKYELAPAVADSWTPKSGSMITELKEIFVEFRNYPVIEKTADFTSSVTCSKGELGHTVEIADGKLKITLDEAQTEEDTYYISIPAKSLAIAKSATDPKQYAPALSYSLAIAGAPTLNMTFPGDGATVPFFSNISLKANYTPSRNRAVTDPIVIKRDGVKVYEMSAGSGNCQYEFMGASGMIDMKFLPGSEKDYTPGTYTVEVPAGVFLMGGVAPSPAATFTFYVPQKAEFTITPAPEQTLPELGTIELYFPGGSDIEFNRLAGVNTSEEDHYLALGSVNGYTSEVTSEELEASMVKIAGDRVTINFRQTSEPGEYTFVIPNGAFTLTQNGQRVSNVLINQRYYITDVNKPAVTPEPGVITPDGLDGNLVVTLQEGEVFAQFNGGTTYYLYRAGDDGLWNDKCPKVASWTYNYAAEGSAKDKSSVTLYPDQSNLNLEEGTYVLRFPSRTIFVKTEGYIVDGSDDEVISEIKVCTAPFDYVYTVVNKPDVDLSYTITPENGAEVASLGTIVIKFEKAEEAVLNGPAAILSNESGSEMIVYIAETAGNVVTLTTTENIGEGKWTLTVPESAYLVDGVDSPAIVAEYTIVKEQSAIEALFGENTPLNVFTVSGICVLRDATAEQVAELEAGLYIINGKKVYLRK